MTLSQIRNLAGGYSGDFKVKTYLPYGNLLVESNEAVAGSTLVIGALADATVIPVRLACVLLLCLLSLLCACCCCCCAGVFVGVGVGVVWCGGWSAGVLQSCSPAVLVCCHRLVVSLRCFRSCRMKSDMETTCGWTRQALLGSAIRNSFDITVTISNTLQANGNVVVRFPRGFTLNDGGPTNVTGTQTQAPTPTQTQTDRQADTHTHLHLHPLTHTPTPTHLASCCIVP
eukprot:2561653-Rhodomonas_salina.2